MNGAPAQPRQPAGHLGLPDPGRADHDDVVRGDLVPDVVRRLRAAPPVPDGDGDRLLGRLLAHDVAVELRHDLPGRHLLQPGQRRCGLGDVGDGNDGSRRCRSYHFSPGSSRMVMCRLVKTQMSAAISSDRWTISRAPSGRRSAAARARRRGRSCRPSPRRRRRRRARSARRSRSGGSCARGRPRPAAPRAGGGSGRCASPWPARRPRAGGSPGSGRASPRTSRTA